MIVIVFHLLSVAIFHFLNSLIWNYGGVMVHVGVAGNTQASADLHRRIAVQVD